MSDGLEQRLLVLAPTARDADFLLRLVENHGMHCLVCPDVMTLVSEAERGCASLVIAEEVLAGGAEGLAELIARQPSWSDLPVLLVALQGADSPAVAHALDTLGNVTLLERPIRVQALISAVRAALRARARQYQTRAHLLELQSADQRKNEFLATLAHELRNPLAPIRNAVQIMRLSGGSAPAAAHLSEMMERQVGHMVRLVDDLLEVSRITRGKIALRKERVTLAAIVDAAIETSRPLIESGRHRLEVSQPEAPLLLDADATRLAQVFANLLNNAAKYTDPGGHIWLSSRREGEQAVVAVRDSGVGIGASALPHVFEMFVQVEQASERAQGGLGIGLTLARSLVEMHGGTVTAQSQGAGRGSEFTVRLPLAAMQEIGVGEAAKAASRPVEAPPRVLVVDDNRDAAESLGMLLQMLGAEVSVVHDGRAALDLVRAQKHAIVFLDLGMPGMDGFEVARRIRQQPEAAGTRLVALTGWGQERDRRETKAAGFDQHLIKPADFAALQGLLLSVSAPAG